MSTLAKAIMVAAEMHEGQFDKGGQPYILHPLRLLLKAQDDESRIVAVLHDVIEDSCYTFLDLKLDEFSKEVINAIDCLTHREGESYEDYIQRIKLNQLATKVKLLDLEDNSDLSRIPNYTEKDIKRAEKYQKAYKDLES